MIFRYFGITKSQNKAFSLTQLGLSLEKRLNSGRDVFYDLMQYLCCTTRDLGDQKRTHFSWSYKTTFDLLWERKSTVVNRKKLAGELLAVAQEEFRSGKISISHEAIRGIFDWLSALDPPFVKDTRKRTIGSGSTRCSLELFVLAIQYLYHVLDLSYKVLLLLDDSKKELINKLSLLKEDSFNWMSDLIIKTFNFVHKHYGEWGTSLILQKRVKIEDLH